MSINPLANRPRADACGFGNGLRRLSARDLTYNALSTARRQPGILVHVHPVLPWNLKLQQPQLPRSEPDGQPTESSQLAGPPAAGGPGAHQPVNGLGAGHRRRQPEARTSAAPKSEPAAVERRVGSAFSPKARAGRRGCLAPLGAPSPRERGANKGGTGGKTPAAAPRGNRELLETIFWSLPMTKP